jgi:hypothetical protein
MNFGILKQFLLFKTIRKTIKSMAQYRAEIGPRLQPSGRDSLPHAVGRKAGWATAWQPSPAGQPAGAVTTRRPREGRRGGVLAGGSAVARRRQGVVGDLEGGTGKVLGKEERVGAHRNDVSMARREESSGTAAFTGGEGAPVVVVECDEILQLGRGKGVMKLQEIVRIGGSGRSSPGNGGRWRRSARIRAREGIPVAGGGGPGAGSGGERCGARVGDRRGVGDEGAAGFSGAV